MLQLRGFLPDVQDKTLTVMQEGKIINLTRTLHLLN
jgi:hypothetical protein